MEGKGKSFGLVKTEGLRAPLLPAGRASQDTVCGLGPVTEAFSAVSGPLPEDGLCWGQCGGTVEELGARHPFLCTHSILGAVMGSACLAEGRGQPPGLPHYSLGPSLLAGVEWDAGFLGWCQIVSLGHFLRSKGPSRSVGLDLA